MVTMDSHSGKTLVYKMGLTFSLKQLTELRVFTHLTVKTVIELFS